MYRAVEHFVDLQDDRHRYDPGDMFPREGLEVTEERLAELAGDKNRLGKPLIVAEVKEEPVAPIEQKQRRGRRKNVG